MTVKQNIRGTASGQKIFFSGSTGEPVATDQSVTKVLKVQGLDDCFWGHKVQFGGREPPDFFEGNHVMTERLHRPAEAASFVERVFKRPFSVAYQAKLRCVGGGPRFVRSGRYIAYAESELIAHFARQVSKPLDSTSSAVQPAAPDAIFDIDDRDLEDEGAYSHLFTGDRTFDQITKEEYPEFDIDLELERAEKRWQFARLT